MSAPIRLLVSDIDGTLIRHDKTLGPPVVAAVRRVQAAGVAVTLISARPVSGMLGFVDQLGIGLPIAAYNGGTIAGPGGKVLSAERLERAVATRALAMLDRPGVTPWVFAHGLWHTRTLANAHSASERINAAADPVIVDDFTGLLGDVDKMVGVSDDEPLLGGLEVATAAALGSAANVVRSQTYYLDVTAPKANKGDGVTALARVAGVPLAAVAVIGDQRNDLRMFAVAGLAIAMGQSHDEIKAAGDYVTLSNDEDGVAVAIDRFVIPAAAGRGG